MTSEQPFYISYLPYSFLPSPYSSPSHFIPLPLLPLISSTSFSYFIFSPLLFVSYSPLPLQVVLHLLPFMLFSILRSLCYSPPSPSNFIFLFPTHSHLLLAFLFKLSTSCHSLPFYFPPSSYSHFILLLPLLFSYYSHISHFIILFSSILPFSHFTLLLPLQVVLHSCPFSCYSPPSAHHTTLLPLRLILFSSFPLIFSSSPLALSFNFILLPPPNFILYSSPSSHIIFLLSTPLFSSLPSSMSCPTQLRSQYNVGQAQKQNNKVSIIMIHNDVSLHFLE